MDNFYLSLQKMTREILKPAARGGLGLSGIDLIRTSETTPDPSRPWESNTDKVIERLTASAQTVGVDMADGETTLVGDIIVRAAWPITLDWRLPEESSGRLAISLDGGEPITVTNSYATPPSGPPVSITFVLRGVA